MHQFVRQDVREKRFEREVLLLRGIKNYARDGNQSLIELCILNVL